MKNQVKSDAASQVNRKTKKFHPWRWVGGIVGIFFLLVIGYVFYVYSAIKDTTQKTYEPLTEQAEQDTFVKQKPVSFLLMGTDTGAVGRTEDRGRTDTLIVVVVNPKTKTTNMVSIPRDTMAQMVGDDKVNVQKINAAYAIGGADMAVNTVSSLLNVPIQNYALVNMGGLEKVVDAVGGVDVQVPFDFEYSGVQFVKGSMHLNGKEALAYARMRKQDPRGDYGRAERQRQMITAIVKAAPSFSNLGNFQTLLNEIQGNFRSSLQFDDMTAAFQHYRVAGDKVNSDVLQGRGAYLGGSSYQIVSTKELQRVSDQLRSALGLEKVKLDNFETKQNAKNPGFAWEGVSSQDYVVHGADQVN